MQKKVVSIGQPFLFSIKIKILHEKSALPLIERQIILCDI